MAECSTPGCGGEPSGCANQVCHCTGDCEKCSRCRGASFKAWDLIRGEGSTVAPFIVTDEDVRRARGGDRYIDKRDPKHPCHRGCTHIWNSHERLWRCIHCGDPDRARPAPATLPYPQGPTLPTPQLPVRPEWTPGGWPGMDRSVDVTYQATCCSCRSGSGPLSINCQCRCHGRTLC